MLKAYSVRLDQETVDFVEGFAKALEYQFGTPANFSSAVRFLLKRNTNTNIIPQFAELTANDQQIISNFLDSTNSTINSYLQTENGVGANLNQIAHIANTTNAIPDSALDYLETLQEQHKTVLAYLHQINTHITQIKAILNLETMVRDTQAKHDRAGDQDASHVDNKVD